MREELRGYGVAHVASERGRLFFFFFSVWCVFFFFVFSVWLCFFNCYLFGSLFLFAYLLFCFFCLLICFRFSDIFLLGGPMIQPSSEKDPFGGFWGHVYISEVLWDGFESNSIPSQKLFLDLLKKPKKKNNPQKAF